jgi:hypothetical protein
MKTTLLESKSLKNPKIIFFFTKIILFSLFLIAYSSASAQEYLSHRQFSSANSNGASVAREVVTDGSGNTYVVGSFQGVTNLGGSDVTSTSIYGDIYLAKYSASNILLWARQIGAANAACMPTGASLFKDASNNVFLYISGYFTSGNGSIITVNFNPGGSGSITMNDTSGDAFVAKYSASNGSFVWVQRVANTSGTVGSGGKITTDGSGNAYVASSEGFLTGGSLKKFNATSGSQTFSISLGSGSIANDVAFRGNQIFVSGYKLTAATRPIAWFDLSGNLISTTGATDRSFSRLTLDNSSGIYAVGGIDSYPQDNVVIEKYTTTTSTTPIWSRSFLSGINGFAGDIVYGGTTSGDLLVTGWFKGSVNFNNSGSYAVNLTSSGGGLHDNIFLARYYASSGNVEWAKNNTSNNSTGQSNPLSISVGNYTVSVLGYVFNRTINASFCGAAQNIDATNASYAFVATYTQRLFAPVISGPTSTLPGETEDYSITQLLGADNYNWIVPTGWTINYYGPGNSYIFTGVGNNSGNVASRAVYDCGNSSLTLLYVNVGSGFLRSIYPNPANQEVTLDLAELETSYVAELFNKEGSKVKSKIFDSDNIIEKKIEVNDLPEGQYFLYLTNANSTLKKQIVIKR